MKNQEEAELKLASKMNKNEDLKVSNLNSMSIIAIMEKDKKKLKSERDLVLKKTQCFLRPMLN